jgi:hypothetical protein
VGYDNLAEMVWIKDQTVQMRVIALSPANALLIASLQAKVMGPSGVRSASNGPDSEAVALPGDADTK